MNLLHMVPYLIPAHQLEIQLCSSICSSVFQKSVSNLLEGCKWCSSFENNKSLLINYDISHDTNGLLDI